jgi:hypothetical protein
VIAVRNGSGKPVMGSIVETEASSILQFIHGLRGSCVFRCWQDRVAYDENTYLAALVKRGSPLGAVVAMGKTL